MVYPDRMEIINFYIELLKMLHLVKMQRDIVSFRRKWILKNSNSLLKREKG